MAAHILAVDDDRAILSFIKMALADEGYSVATAENGRVALDRLAEHRPDLVLLDLNMPVMTGWELQAHLRALVLNIPVVFMTAGGRARQEAVAHHAQGHLAKPFGLDELLDVVAHYTSEPAR
jgi:CheY-like chemotaxis protein